MGLVGGGWSKLFFYYESKFKINFFFGGGVWMVRGRGGWWGQLE